MIDALPDWSWTHRKPRRAVRVRSALLLLVPAVVVLLGVAALILYSARSDLRAGQRQLERARSGLSMSAVERDPVLVLGHTRSRLLAARSDFASARDHLGYLEPVLAHLGWLPGVGSELAEAGAAARMASDTADGAVALLDGLDPLLARLNGVRAQRRISISSAVALIAAGREDFNTACSRFDAAQRARAQAGAFGIPALKGRLEDFDRNIGKLEVACRTLVKLPMLLGVPRPYTYLVAYQNPAQIRATGGFIGSIGRLTVHDGRASEQFIGTGLRDKLSFAPPQPLELYDREPGWLLRDSNWSPDFPTTAQLERFFAHLDLGWSAPGVINVTPQAVADAVGATGSFYSPEYGRWITAGNVAQLADFYAHRSAYHGPLRSGNYDTRRKQFIGIVADHLFHRFASLGPSGIVRLVHAVTDDLAQGSILLNFSDAHTEGLLQLAGVTGAVPADTSDFLYIVDSNLSYNKINPYVRISVDDRVTIQANRWLRVSLKLHFKNVPAPSYVYADSLGPGAGRGGGPADYSDFVRILVPGGAAIVSESGWTQAWTPGLAYGKTMLSGYVVVRAGTTRTVLLTYVVPPNVFSWSNGQTYRLVVPHQPGSAWRSLRLRVSADGNTLIQTVVHSPLTELRIQTPVQRRPFNPIPLPQNPEPVVAPGRWIEPHTYLGPVR